MTDDEWDAIAYVLEEGWKGDFPDDKRRVFRMFLDAYDPATIMSALHRLTMNGKPFRPEVAEVVKAILDVQIPPVPSWSEAWNVIQRAMTRSGRRSPRKVGLAHATEWLEANAHPVVTAFVAAEDLGVLTLTEFGDPEYGGARVANLEKRYREFVGIANERLERGLALESHARRAIGPARFDPQRALSFVPGSLKEIPAETGDPPS